MKRREILEGRNDEPQHLPQEIRSKRSAPSRDRISKDPKDSENALKAMGLDKPEAFSVYRSKPKNEGADAELKQYLMKDVYDKMKHLNQMYTKAKHLGDNDLMSKIKVAMAKVAAKKSKLASELGISEAELDEMATGQEQKTISGYDPVKKTVKVKDTTGKETEVKQSDIQKDPKDPTGRTFAMTSLPDDEFKSAVGGKVNVVPATSEQVETLKKLAGL